MKKAFLAAMIGTFVLSMAACGGQATESSESEPAVSSESIASPEAMTQEDVAAPDFSGTYTEPMSGRCQIEIESLGKNNYKINVVWSSSAFESSNWEINATYYDSTTLLEYTGAKHFIRTFTSDEEYTDDVIYTDGAGEFWFEEDGTLGWRSANSDVDYITGETKFERVEVITE